MSRILVSTDKVSNLNKSVEELREMFSSLTNNSNFETFETQTNQSLVEHTEAINEINQHIFSLKNDVEELKKFIDNLTTALGSANKVSLKIKQT